MGVAASAMQQCRFRKKQWEEIAEDGGKKLGFRILEQHALHKTNLKQ